jgi:O-antigen/teichoic acid export membrane protein
MEQAPTGSRLIRNSLFSLFNTLFMLATTWIISIWVARQLGPSGYGIFTLVLWFTGTVSWALGMGLIHAITKFVAEAQGRSEPIPVAIVVFVLKLELILSIPLTAVLFFLRAPIADYFFSPNESFYFLIAFLGLVPGVVTAIFSATIEGIQKFEYFTYSNLVVTPLSFGAKVVVLSMGYGIEGLLLVMLIFSFVNVLFYAWALRREGFFKQAQSSGPLDKSTRGRLMRYNRSVGSILLCDKVVWDKSENLFLGRFCAANEIAFYNLGFNIAQRFMSILPTTLWRVLFPAMSSYFGSGNESKVKRLFYVATRYLAFVSFPVGVAGTLLSYELIHYLYGHEYIGAQRVLQILFMTAIITSLSKPASAILYGFEKQGFILRYGIILAVLNIAMNFLMIPRMGALGAALGYGIIAIMGSGGGIIYTCRLMKLRYPFGSLLKMLGATIIMGLCMQLILWRFPGALGFALSVVSGAIVYLGGSIVLGTFESEDLALLQSAKAVLPAPIRGVAQSILEFIVQLKHASALNRSP